MTPLNSWGSRQSRWWGEAVEPRIQIARQLRTGGSGLVTALIVINVLLGLLPVAFVVATSVVIGRVPAAVAAGVHSPAMTDLMFAFVAAALTFVMQQALTPLRLALGELLKWRVDGHVHDRIIEISLRSPGIGPMEDQNALDELQEASRRLEGSYETPGQACAGLIALLARYCRLVGFGMLVGVAASWIAGIALVLATMVFRYGNRGGLRRYAQVARQVVTAFRRGNYLRDLALRGEPAKELRIFRLTSWLADRYAQSYRAWLDPVWRARRRIYLYPYLAYTSIGLVVAIAVFLVLARGAVSGTVSLTGLALGLQATMAALLLGEYYPESDDSTQSGMLATTALGRFEVAVDRYARANSRLTKALDPACTAEPTLHFAGVSFRYPGGSRAVLDGLDLELAAGRCTAVVGVNGAGKTTLVKLLTRLYQPTAGTIRFGGTDIDEFDVTAWRRQVSVVFQDFIRYELSIADNIAFGAVHLPRDLVRIGRAAARAGILDAVADLPDGLDTPLSRAYSGGIDLSGGQWQRIAIARCLYGLDGGARLLVLDEPTAALDVRAEARFFEQFVDLTRGVTSLLISHRFSSVRHADHIVFVAGGKVVEQGSHDDLVAAGGQYAELFALQAQRFAAGLDSADTDAESASAGSKVPA